ncbi:MAG TPA: NAD-dependent epimerase/dehydratase family protein, partial [Polyangiales bacterium]|nr:NAD-dependent epimerase/dehydratase family protein [Polyangiales bacterium]
MSKQRPTVLVTGATGFVGAHLVKDARARGLHAIALTRRFAAGAGEQRVVTGWSVPALSQALENV